MMAAFRPLCHRGTCIAMQQRIACPRPSPRFSIHSTTFLSSASAPPCRDQEDASTSTSSMKTTEQLVRKRLDVALVGAPNAGKSQLLNSLIGSKVAAVSRKRHTTRSK